MNQCVPLAHYLARTAKQRTSGCGTGSNAGSGPSLPVAFCLREDAHVDEQTSSMMSQQQGESAVSQTAVGRHNPSLSLSACPGYPHTQKRVLSSTRPRQSCELTRLTTGRLFSQLYQTVLLHIYGFVSNISAAFIAAARGKGAKLRVFTVQS